jgi:hypothetical protein
VGAKLQDASDHDLRDLRAATKDAIEAMAWFDLQVDAFGLRQSGAEWSAAAEALRRIDAEQQRRLRRKKN